MTQPPNDDVQRQLQEAHRLATSANRWSKVNKGAAGLTMWAVLIPVILVVLAVCGFCAWNTFR